VYLLQRATALPILADLRGRAARVDLTRGTGSFITASADTLPQVQDLLQPLFQTPIVRAGFVVLQPSQQLVAHRDPAIAEARYHLPLWLNPRCWVFHEDFWQQLEEGAIYRMDPADWHGAVNWGETTRVHLFADVEAA